MSKNFNKDRYENISIEFNQCLGWFESLGLKINITRLFKYKKDLDLLIKVYNLGETENIREKFPDIFNAFYEIRDILDIYNGLKDGDLNLELKKRLKKYIEGPNQINNEKISSSSNTPRDIGFELFMGSRFILGGHKVFFKKEGDLEFIFKERNIYIECKRPTNKKRLQENIKKAFRQLENRYKTDPEARGIIAISINKIINNDNNLLIGVDVDALSETMSKTVECFIRENERLWQKNIDKRTIGVIILFQSSCISKKDNMLVVGREMGLNNITIKNDSDFNLLIELTQNIKNSF